MVKQLRKKFITVGMISVIIAEILMIGTIDLINYNSTISGIRQQMSIIVEHGGDLSEFTDENRMHMRPPDLPEGELPDGERSGPHMGFSGQQGINEETPFMLRFFTVSTSADGEITEIDVDRIATVDESLAKKLVNKLQDAATDAGFCESFYYERISSDDGIMYIFLDVRRDIGSFSLFRNVSIAVGMLGALLVFIILIPMSHRVLSPVEESYRKQKRFITDASHEIKTPLAIISADAEVLELDLPDNEWVESIKHQVKRLTGLTEKLVMLSRMDEGVKPEDMRDLDYSALVKKVSDSYLSMVSSLGRVYDADIAKGIHIRGSEGNLIQMVSMLMDNAFKYSDEGGTIRVSLGVNGKKSVLSVYNTVTSIEVGDLRFLFDRFYRADASRSSDTGGSGIGLSVVKAVAESHGGRAEAKSSDGRSVEFRITI